jgi:hypothetical protein
VLVDPLLFRNRVELDLRRVVGLDRLLEVRVDRLDLCEDLLRFGPLRSYRGGAGRGREQGGREEDEQNYEDRLSRCRSDQNPPVGSMAGADWGGGAVTSRAL